MKKRIGPKPMVFPMPAVLVGTYSEDRTPNAMTAAWAAACCLQPPCLGVAINRSRLTFDNIQRIGAFTINVPRTNQAAAVDFLGMVSGKKNPGKLADAGMETTAGSKVDAPIITSCPVNVECKLAGSLALGSHMWFAGEVMEIQVDEQYLLEDGKVDVDLLDPLLYITSLSEYRGIRGRVADAYSVGKKLMRD